MRLRRRTIRKIIWITIALVILIIGVERLYNNQEKFQTRAEDVEYYGIIDAGFTSNEKMRDFKQIYELLEESYPFFEVNKRINDLDWFANERIYRRILKNTSNDAEYLVALDMILGDLNDYNTFAMDGDTYRRYLKHNPDKVTLFNNIRSVGRYMFFEGVDNIELDPNNDLIFHNGPVLETHRLIEDEVAYMKIEAMSHYHIEEDYPVIKEFLGQIEDYDKLIIDIRGNSGWADQYWMNIVELLIDEVHNAEYYSFFKHNPSTALDLYKLEDITVIRNLDEEILGRFPSEIATYLKFYKVNTIEIQPNEDINFNGEIYLLVDDGVKSSAEKFAAFSKDTGFATLVGGISGGGMTFDEIPVEYLRIGGFMISYSREMAMNSDGSINMEEKTSPHILVDDTSPNKNIDEDKCIQAVLDN